MVDVTKVNEILERHGSKRERMIAILLDCQEEYYYLPREVLEAVAAGVQYSADIRSGHRNLLQGVQPQTHRTLSDSRLQRHRLQYPGRAAAGGCSGARTEDQEGRDHAGQPVWPGHAELRRMLRAGARDHGRTGCARESENILRAQDGQAIPAKSPAEPKEAKDAQTVH